MAYRCSNCGYVSVKWLGQCPKCEEWDTLQEARTNAENEPSSDNEEKPEKPQPLPEISSKDKDRLTTEIGEFDRVFGGGLIPGSVSLIGGPPGTGKSTLLLQAAQKLSGFGRVLYISGEESNKQIKTRARRLNLDSEKVLIYSGRNINNALNQILKTNPVCVIVDSIQSLGTGGETDSALGSTKQVRELGQRFAELAKKEEIATILIGHITKAGKFAGPKAIEHLVDATFYLEGEKEDRTRILRPNKNRFGSTDGLGLFKMTEKGLTEIKNPSRFFANRNRGKTKGSAVVCTMEGSRPIMAEVQALVAPPNYSGQVQRKSTGLDYNRVSLLLAVLEKQLELSISGSDVYLNVVGGFKLSETAVDLAIIGAILSSYFDKPLEENLLLAGEVGLGGNLRPVDRLDKRLQESAKLGYNKAVIPEMGKQKPVEGCQLVKISNLQELIPALGLKKG